jgi:GNAT superfamily N-acetyltransferase
MPIELNELETNRFGIVAANVTDAGANTKAIDAAARDKCVKMLTARIPASDLSRAHDFEAAGYRLMDTLVYYTRDLGNLPPRLSPPGGMSCRLATPEDAGEVGRVARAGFSGYLGHYHADPRLNRAAADAVYVEWAESSTARTSPMEPVIVAESNGTIVGFLTLRRNNEWEMELVLSAVHPDYNGKGLYSIFIAEGLDMARNLAANQAITSTQINNYAVQRVWARLGFFHSRSIYTFHKWF